MPVTSSISVLAGARAINATHMAFAYEDLAGKVATLVSFMNAATSAISALNVAVSTLNAAGASAAASGLTWSALSGALTSSILLNSYPGTVVNFTA